MTISSVINYHEIQSDQDWKIDIEQQIISDERLLEEAEMMGEDDKYTNIIQQKIMTNKFYLEKNVNPITDSVLEFINKHIGLTTLISIFSIIYASGIMSNEFNLGTITFIAIKPFSRTKIFFGKYIAILFLILGFYILLLLLLSIGGLILFGFKNLELANVIVVNDRLVNQNIILSIFNKYSFSLIPTITFATIAFMISIIVRNPIIATAISLGFLLFGGALTNFVKNDYWAMFIFFLNTNLNKFESWDNLINNSTLLISVIINLIYIILFLLIPLYFFKKRDIV